MTKQTTEAPKAAPTPQNVLETIIKDVSASVVNNEGAFYNAAKGLFFLSAYSQTFELRGESPVNAKKFESNFYGFLKHYVGAGNAVWVKPKTKENGEPVLSPTGRQVYMSTSDELSAALKGAKGKEARVAAIVEYLDTKKRPEGWRMAKGLSRLKGIAKAMTEELCKAHSGFVADLLKKQEAGADKAGLKAMCDRFVAEKWGSSGTELEAYFQSGGGAGFDAAKWAENIVKKAKEGKDKIPTAILTDLVKQLQNIVSERVATAEIAAELTGATVETFEEEEELAAAA